MTPEELQELRDWSARKLGWVEMAFCYCYSETLVTIMPVSSWLPDRPESGQIWMLVERMRELGYEMKLGFGDTIQGVLCWVRFTNESHSNYFHDPNPCLAILKAARATEE